MNKSGLQVGNNVVLDATGGGRITLGPNSSAGPANWHVTGVIVQTNRPGLAPVPSVKIYLDVVSNDNIQGMAYDGSFTPSRSADVKMVRGQFLIAVWAGGQAGDIASLTLTGEKW